MSWFQAAQIGLGLLGLGQARKQDRAATARANRNEYLNSPAGIRAEAEKAGFNPLVFTNQVGGFGGQLGFSGSTANALQTLSGTFGDLVNQNLREQELEAENKRLSMLAQKSMLKPNANKVTYNPKQVTNDISGVRAQSEVTVETLPDKSIDPKFLSDVEYAISQSPDGSVPKTVSNRVTSGWSSTPNPYDNVMDNLPVQVDEAGIDEWAGAAIRESWLAGKAVSRGWKPNWMMWLNNKGKQHKAWLDNKAFEYQQFNNGRKVK